MLLESIISTALVSYIAPTEYRRQSRRLLHNPVQQERLVEEKSDASPNRQSADSSEESQNTIPVEVVADGSPDHIFGARVTITNVDTEEKYTYTTLSGQEPLFVPAGTYTAVTLSSSQSFPQEAKYQVVNNTTGEVVIDIPRTHVPVTNLVLRNGYTLRVLITPAIRSYNSVFYRIGGSPVAHVIARPYDSFQFGVDEFTGREQFPSAQIVVAFWGMKGERENPAEAARIRKEGMPLFATDGSDTVYDPVAVFGTKKIAEDLAQTFVRSRHIQDESYRGEYHISFLLQRTPRGNVPLQLMEMTYDELVQEFWKRLLWMEHFNVHRETEGGGYAAKTFGEVIEQSKERVYEWSQISYESTEIAVQRALDAVQSSTDQDLIQAYRIAVRAIRRERMNYQNYESDWLADLRNSLSYSLESRDARLQQLEKQFVGQLQKLIPNMDTEKLEAKRTH